MAAMLALRDYGDSDSAEEEGESGERTRPREGQTESPELVTPFHSTFKLNKSLGPLTLNAAPEVAPNDSLDRRLHIDPTTKELSYNPKYEELFAPHVGPLNPFLTQQQRAHKNTLSGFVEPAHLNEFQFENQRRTFQSYGYAVDPTAEIGEVEKGEIIGDVEAAKEQKLKTVFESTKLREADKRKRVKNSDPSDVEGYLGPWGGFVGEQRVIKPTPEEAEELEEYLAKRQKRGKHVDDKPMEEKTILHIKDDKDYMGRSFLHIPQDVGINLRAEEPPAKCFLPKKLIHTWQGHTKGVSAIKWFPKSAHLLLSASMDTKIKIWEAYGQRRCIRSYIGHRQAVRDICFDNSGQNFLSASYDRFIKLWNTETGQCISRFTSRKVPYCVKFNPDEEKQHLFVAGTSDKKIVCWDTRSGEIVQEYDRHLGAVNTITFVDDNRRFVSTSDDKSIRVWEWDIPVDMKYIADPSMHSMPAVTLSPNQKWLAMQSMDNKIAIFSAINRFKYHRKKTFKGHMVAGYACSIDFSPEMSFLISGDADGKVFVWDWKTTKLLTKWKAHDNVCISVLWHPHETSKVVSAGWDGLIKYWD
ncbi:unnamed protein product [Darwinula stevensoni]|uniref:Pre-mRNA-processing factor 17 n=1 Tax=Darwinula stevensoni TaxID=69355 RepID=A0A7R9FQ38_9CRUS|nr:unnamed protein product [Darwinula stevensoni]CAG0898940.1 unnamed protein product [Darwinula stevensoni]